MENKDISEINKISSDLLEKACSFYKDFGFSGCIDKEDQIPFSTYYTALLCRAGNIALYLYHESDLTFHLEVGYIARSTERKFLLWKRPCWKVKSRLFCGKILGLLRPQDVVKKQLDHSIYETHVFHPTEWILAYNDIISLFDVIDGVYQKQHDIFNAIKDKGM